MFLYMAVKVAWVLAAVFGAIPGASDMNAHGLALAQKWGKCLPGSFVLLFSWMASGFLVSLLPHSLLSALLDSTGADPGGESESLPRWESALIMIGFVGMAAGLLVAVPVYIRTDRDVRASRHVDVLGRGRNARPQPRRTRIVEPRRAAAGRDERRLVCGRSLERLCAVGAQSRACSDVAADDGRLRGIRLVVRLERMARPLGSDPHRRFGSDEITRHCRY